MQSKKVKCPQLRTNPLSGRSILILHSRQFTDDSHGFDTDLHHSPDQINNIARIVAVAVGVAAVLDAVLLNYPFERRTVAKPILVDLDGDAEQRQHIVDFQSTLSVAVI
jgi:hypothetical protein